MREQIAAHSKINGLDQEHRKARSLSVENDAEFIEKFSSRSAFAGQDREEASA